MIYLCATVCIKIHWKCCKKYVYPLLTFRNHWKCRVLITLFCCFASLNNTLSVFFNCLFSAPPKSVSFTRIPSDRLKCVADKVKPNTDATIVLMNDTTELTSYRSPSNNQVTQTTGYNYLKFTYYDNLQNWLYCNVTWRGQVFIAHLQEPLVVNCKYYTASSFY